MLSRLELNLGKCEDISINSSSLFHGSLFDFIANEYADELHSNGVKPYSQNLSRDREGNWIWTVNTMNEKAKENIIDYLLSDSYKEVNIKHKELKIPVLSKELRTSGYKELLDEYYFKDSSRYITMKFISPTAFKSRGNYVFCPNFRLIYQSVMNKYDSVFIDSQLFDEEILENLVENTQLINYNLRSFKFHLEGITIPSFMGHMTIRINGPQAMVNLANYMLRFGEYSGVGIKATIGMGGFKILD